MNAPFEIRIYGAGPHHNSPTLMHDADRVAFIAAQTLADNGFGLTVGTFRYGDQMDDMLPELVGHPSSTDNSGSAIATILQRVMLITGMPLISKPGGIQWTMERIPEWLTMTEEERVKARLEAVE